MIGHPRHCTLLVLIACTVTMLRSAVCSSMADWTAHSNQTSIECVGTRCPVTTACNLNTNRCECENAFLVSVNPHIPCLTRKYLGELCIHSVQCSHIEHAVCVSNAKKRHELLLLPLKDLFANIRMVKHPEKYLPRKEFGRCECKAGYWPNQNHRCEVKRLESVECSATLHCPDQNSHCNLVKRKCACDFGHFYDPTQDRCLLNVDMFGVFCKSDLDCQVRDDQMRCWMGICTCMNNNRYDPFRGCGHVQPCKNGHTWNDFSKSCEPTVFNYKPPIWTNFVDNKPKPGWREWTQLSAEVCFKILVFGLVLIGAFFTLKKRKCTLSGQNPSPTSLDYARGNSSSRVNQAQTAPNVRMHSVHLRVNLTEVERDSLMLNVTPLSRRLSLVSGSSLPPYEAAHSGTERSASEALCLDSPPPLYEQLPTYEQATTDLVKRDQSCAKKPLSQGINDSTMPNLDQSSFATHSHTSGVAGCSFKPN